MVRVLVELMVPSSFKKLARTNETRSSLAGLSLDQTPGPFCPAAREAAGAASDRPRIVAVTVLTSLDQNRLNQVGVTGSVAERAVQVMSTMINPAIASHGGMAEVVAVEESTAYVRLGGGWLAGGGRGIYRDVG